MVSWLLLAVAALCWPVGLGRRPPPTGGASVNRSSVRRAGWWQANIEAPSVWPATSTGGGRDRFLRKPYPPMVLAAACCAGALSFVVAGTAGLLATLMMLGTTLLLIRQEMTQRRRRMALVDVLAALRLLGRELQAGADPGSAAVNGAAVARGEGALVLAEFARLTRTENRSAGGGFGRGVDEVTSPSVRAQVLARLAGGWLLTRWHGLAFTPLVTALAQDLSEQQVAGSERAGQVAGPRTSGYVMALLPLLGLALGAGMGADPVRVLVGSAVGNVLLLVGVGLTCAGLLWSARIVAP